MPRELSAYQQAAGETRVVADKDSLQELSNHFTLEHRPPGGPPIELSKIKFQEGDPSQVGINGVTDVMVLTMLADRLRVEADKGNNSKYSSAYYHVNEAIKWLRSQ